MYIIVAYDIAHEKRLRKVAAVMENYGVRVQRSVFECLVDEDLRERMTGELTKVIEPGADSIRVYHLCQACRNRVVIYGLGQVTSDPDVYVF